MWEINFFRFWGRINVRALSQERWVRVAALVCRRFTRGEGGLLGRLLPCRLSACVPPVPGCARLGPHCGPVLRQLR